MTNLPLRNHGFSLIEVLVVIAVLALLATIAVPSVSGVIKGGKSKGYDAERETLQLTVDSWRSTVGKQTGPLVPILQCGESGPCFGGTVDLSESCIGTVDTGGELTTPLCNPYLDIGALSEEGFVRNVASVKSAKTSKNTTAENSPSGSYGWYVGTGSLVTSFPPKTDNLFP